jgi:hypothetical protein
VLLLRSAQGRLLIRRSLVRAQVEDPNHPEHAGMRAWIGRDWDPAAFDIEHVNSWLAEIKL